MKGLKLTYKRHERKGLTRIGGGLYIDISHKRKKVGIISTNLMTSDYIIQFAIEKEDINEDGNPNCTWRWMVYRLPKETYSLEEIKERCVMIFNKIALTHKIHNFEK